MRRLVSIANGSQTESNIEVLSVALSALVETPF